MKNNITLALVSTLILALTGCATGVGPNGQQTTGLSPTGAAVLQTVLSTGIGTAAGALMHGQNSVAVGAVSAGAGSIGGQVINAFVPTVNPNAQPAAVPTVQNQTLYKQNASGQMVPIVAANSHTIYRQLPNGTFVPVQQ